MKVQIFATPNLIIDPENNKSVERYKQEIENLKSIIQSLMKMNKNNPENNINTENEFNKDELIKVMAEEATELKQGNLFA